MGWGTGNIGGGSGGLNFKIVGGTAEPSNPKENMIWIITDQKITSYIFSAEEPESPVDGMVWITVGTSSTVEFNALKKNGIQVYPISAKQYVSGARVDVTAMIYQGGEWVEWIKYLYNVGNEFENLTGGWISRTGGGEGIKTASKNDNGLYLYTNYSSGDAFARVGFSTNSLIDLSGINAIVMEVNILNKPQAGRLVVATSIENAANPDTGTYAAAIMFESKEGETTVSLDVSGLTGSYYVGFGIANGNDDRTGECLVPSITYV